MLSLSWSSPPPPSAPTCSERSGMTYTRKILNVARRDTRPFAPRNRRLARQSHLRHRDRVNLRSPNSSLFVAPRIGPRKRKTEDSHETRVKKRRKALQASKVEASNLRPLNRFISSKPFHMETLAAVIQELRKDWWGIFTFKRRLPRRSHSQFRQEMARFLPGEPSLPLQQPPLWSVDCSQNVYQNLQDDSGAPTHEGKV